MKRNKLLLIIISITMLFSFLPGCSKEKASSNIGKNNQGPDEISYFVGFTPNGSANLNTRSDTELMKEIEKRLNLKIKFIHPAGGQEQEQFNIMIASSELPDIIEYDWLNKYPGGVEKALKDGKLIELNDVIDKYTPNLKKYLQSKPDIDKMVRTDSGKYYVFPFLRGDPILCVNFGITLRKDWLDELGLNVPETIDEWHTVLKAFKEKKGSTTPLTFTKTNIGENSDSFIEAFGISKNFYLDNGKVKYGSIQPQYEEFLKTFHQWYQEGLIDKDFPVIDRKTLDARILNNQAGAFLGWVGSNMGNYLDSMKEKDQKFDLVPAPYPVLKKGDRPQFGVYTNMYSGYGSVGITSKCKNVEAAARFLDYGYSAEGQMLYNFGIEGKSYTMVNGEPVYTDEILKNPQGLTTGQAMSKYIRAQENGPFVQDKRFIYQYYKYPQQKKALELWSDTDAAKNVLPPLTYNETESKRYAAIMNEVNTYADEMFYKFIMGVEPLESYDNYVEQLNKLGIAEATSIVQGALDRYNKR